MVQTPADPGSIAVPLSSLLDALESVLTQAERDALFQQLVGAQPTIVAPGDLITADLFNKMLGDIDDLMERVAALEGVAGGPIIDLLAPAKTVAVNSILTVTGRNFNPEPRFNIVKIGDVEITQFRGDSTPTNLIFAVPDMFLGLPAQFAVRVLDGSRTSNAMPITIVEQDKTQQGNFVFHNTASPQGVIKVGDTLNFTWNVQAVTVFDDQIALSLQVGQVQGGGVTANSWLSTVQIQPASPLAIQAGQTKSVSVSVKVPANATSAQLSLKALSKDGNVTNFSDPITVTVGGQLETPDPRIDVKVSVASLGTAIQAGPVDIDGNTLQGFLVKKSGSNGKMKVDLVDMRPAAAPGHTNPPIDYQYAIAFVAPTSDFAVDTPAPTSDSGILWKDQRQFTFHLTPTVNAAIGATAQLKVTCSQTKTGTDLATYKSFRIIPLKIVS